MVWYFCSTTVNGEEVVTTLRLGTYVLKNETIALSVDLPFLKTGVENDNMSLMRSVDVVIVVVAFCFCQFLEGNNGVSGTIPPELGMLTDLKFLSFCTY